MSPCTGYICEQCQHDLHMITRSGLRENIVILVCTANGFLNSSTDCGHMERSPRLKCKCQGSVELHPWHSGMGANLILILVRTDFHYEDVDSDSNDSDSGMGRSGIDSSLILIFDSDSAGFDYDRILILNGFGF